MPLPHLTDVRARLHALSPARAEAALARLDDGTWGICFTCGDPIEAARLDADPSVGRCDDCEREARRDRDGRRLGVCGQRGG